MRKEAKQRDEDLERFREEFGDWLLPRGAFEDLLEKNEIPQQIAEMFRQQVLKRRLLPFVKKDELSQRVDPIAEALRNHIGARLNYAAKLLIYQLMAAAGGKQPMARKSVRRLFELFFIQGESPASPVRDGRRIKPSGKITRAGLRAAIQRRGSDAQRKRIAEDLNVTPEWLGKCVKDLGFDGWTDARRELLKENSKIKD
jgi:hypothetical protein